jgi:SAM-dependent methyltransferase
MSKDLFSEQSDQYAKFRPSYPRELFEYLLKFVKNCDHAWDCATGNGQAAGALAEYFKKVEASDLSESQIKKSILKNNIEYHVCPAEHTPFADNSFDLITVAQAYHWLNWEKFHKEASRVAKEDAVIAIWGYNLLISDDPVLNRFIDYFYYEVVGPYWDPERKYVDESYATADFDFTPLPSRNFVIRLQWNRQQFFGYLKSWSSVRNYIKKNNSTPLDLVWEDLEKIWGEKEEKLIQFPLFLKLGRVKSL